MRADQRLMRGMRGGQEGGGVGAIGSGRGSFNREEMSRSLPPSLPPIPLGILVLDPRRLTRPE